MAKDDDRYEYVKGTYKYKKGLTPDQSRETAGAWRATLRDDGGHLDGQAEFIPGGEDEYEKQPDREPVYIYVNEMREADARSRERSEQGQTSCQEMVERPGTPGDEVRVEQAGEASRGAQPSRYRRVDDLD